MDDITRYQLASLSALPFWFGPFYASYVQRGFVMERVLKTPIPPLSAKTLIKSFGLTAVYQPLFPYVGVVTPKVHRLLFGTDEQFYQRVISTSLVSSSTALVVNPFETLMLKVRTGITGVNYFLGTDIWVEVPNIRFDVWAFSPDMNADCSSRCEKFSCRGESIYVISGGKALS